MFSRLARLSIRTQLVLLVLVVFVPTFAVFLKSLADERIVAQEAAYARLKVHADTTAAGLKAFFDSNQAVLGRLAQRPKVRQLNARDCDPILREYVSLHPEFTNVVVRDVAGTHECTVFPGGVSQARLLTFPWFQQALPSNEFKVGEAFVGPQSGRWVSVMSHPVQDEAGTKTGLLILPIDLLNLNRTLLGSIPSNVVVSVSDGAQKFVLRSQEPEKWVGKPAPTQVLSEPGRRMASDSEGPGVDGVLRLYAFTTVPGVGWRVMAGVPKDAAFAASDAAFRRGGLTGLGILLLALLLAWRMGRGMVRPIESLANTVVKLGAGDAAARVPFITGPHEIETVAHAVNHMLEARALAEASLRDSEENLSITLQSIGDAVIATNPQGLITRMNTIAERLTGWSLADAAGRPLVDVFRIVNAHTRQTVADPVQLVMSTGHVVGLANHTVLVTRGGQEHQISDSAAPILDTEGRIRGVVMVFSDVTEQYRVQEALREKEQRLSFLLSRTPAVFRTVRATGDFGMTFVSDSVRDLLGYEPQQFVADPDFWVRHIHPSDKERVLAFRGSSATDDQTVHEYRFRHNNGTYRWLLDEARLCRDATGQPTEWLGVWIDITERKDADAALFETQARYRALVEWSPVGIAVHRRGRLVFVNPAAVRMLGAGSAADLAGKRILELVTPDDRETVLQDIQEALAWGGGEAPRMNSAKLVRLDGRTIEVESQSTAFTFDAEAEVQVSFLDVSARRQMEAQSESERSVLEQLARGEPLQATLNHLTRSYEEMWPGTMCSILLVDETGRTLTHCAAPSLPRAYCNAIDGAEIGQGQGSCGTAAFTGEVTMVTDIANDPLWRNFKDIALAHQLRACWSVPILSTQGVVLGTFAVYLHVPRAAQANELAALKRGADLASLAIERDQVAAQIHQLAFYDALTALPNRRMLMERLKIAILSSVRHRCHGALLFIDLDNFKTLNDTQGHDVGDQLLQQVAKRLLACVREADAVARLGGDEFVVMLENLSGDALEAASQAEVVGQKILNVFSLSFTLKDREHLSTPSIGIALFGESAPGVDDLLKQADLAMYQAKAGGRNTLRFFDSGMQLALESRVAMEADLRDGLRRQEMLLHYQPVVQGDGRVTGAEALVRWLQPQRGLVPPGEFIGLAEVTGLILPLGQWVLHTACAQLAAWASCPEFAQLTMAVNVSAHQFREADFVEKVGLALDMTGANPHLLKLELTESLLADSVEDIITKMVTLRERGVSFSLDDFGTGYSSLSYLKRLPLSQLKIDQSFVRDVLTDPNDAAIARTIVLLSQSLGLAVIAEGVETDGQRQFLADSGCMAYQGYFFSRPLPIEQFEAFVTRQG